MLTSVKSAPVTHNAAVLWFYRGRIDIFLAFDKMILYWGNWYIKRDVKHITSNIDKKALQDIIPVMWPLKF